MVYAMTPMGMRKPAVVLSMPVSALTVAAPPRMEHGGDDDVGEEAEVDEHLVRGRTPASVDDLAHGVRGGGVALHLDGEDAEESTWMVAPEAYQKGPETPYWKATLED